MPNKQHRRLLLILIALISGIALVSWVQAQPIPLPLDGTGRASVELLTNGDFEIDTDADKNPDTWEGKKTDEAKADKLKCNKEGKVFAYSGDCAFMFKGNDSGQSSKLKQTIESSSIVDGSTLSLSAFVDQRSGVPNSKIASAKVKLSDGTNLKLELRLPDIATSDYELLTDQITVALPSGVTITGAAVDFRYGEATGKFLIDDASLTVSTDDGPTMTPTHTETPRPPVQLFASDGAAGDEFGWSVSVSADGKTALVGTYNDDIDANSGQGAVHVYTNTGNGAWNFQQKLIIEDGEGGDAFGWSVSVSADGNTALVGALNEDVGANTFQGSAYVFTRTGTTWTLQQQLTANNGAEGDYFGWSVSLSADGSTALIGAPSSDISSNANQGSAYIFVRSGTTWTQQQQIAASDGAADDLFGSTVSLSADGNTALVGASYHTVGMNANQGAAYVYSRTGTTWTQQQRLLANDGASNDLFASSVSLSGDGSTALVSAHSDDVGANADQGSAYFYVRSGNTWAQQQQLLAPDGAPADSFGLSVSLNFDGNAALIGAPFKTISTNSSQGAAYLYKRSAGILTYDSMLIGSPGEADDNFGIYVSMSGDAIVGLVGVPRDNVGTNDDQGSAWAFDLR
jgi:hypothetical protein